MNTIIKDERAKIEKYREADHKHYQDSVDELHRKQDDNFRHKSLEKLSAILW